MYPPYTGQQVMVIHGQQQQQQSAAPVGE